MALEEIGQTVILFGDQHADAGAVAGVVHLVAHLKHFRDGGKGGGDFVGRNLQALRGELHPHQKVIRLLIGMVIRVENVAAEVVDESGHTGDNPLPVFTVDQNHHGIFASGCHSGCAPFVKLAGC
ncbi:hypothetical protein NITLEN_11143 [Nitrospira lenta]|uniref:Uncharacterized protein n=1 Tax=Nitrospira lenta TaxID=1436998 RepID=A0A330L443_9BACT|nr:hypothetical protein NITLEN_11143 [Nitrospira lenta]